MTEAEWLGGNDPKPMLEFLLCGPWGRKFRLFALACCDRIAGHITDPRSQAAVRFAEQHVEAGVKGRRGRPAVVAGARTACSLAYALPRTAVTPEDAARALLEINAAHAADGALDTVSYHAALFCSGFASNTVGWASGHAAYEAAQRGEKAVQADLVRDVFGPLPFREVAVAPPWLTWNAGAVPRLAQAIYEERAFDRLPILADALEEAGGTDAALLGHCRAPGPHVRGCWVIDLLLGKG
jgi:hypothetical protein